MNKFIEVVSSMLILWLVLAITLSIIFWGLNLPMTILTPRFICGVFGCIALAVFVKNLLF